MGRFVVDNIPIRVVRKRIKNLHLGVYPPDGSVRISAPVGMKDEAIRLAVASRLGWIRKHQAKFRGQTRESRREMVDRESHYFLGQRRLLRVVERPGRPEVRLAGTNILEVHVPSGTSQRKRQAIVTEWLRWQMKQVLPELTRKWEGVIGVRMAKVGVKRMKTKWGSCNAGSGRIWLNLDLIRKPEECLEYVLVHEMVHLLERKHNDRFVALMDEFMPNWRLRKEKLNAFPLSHAEWGY